MYLFVTKILNCNLFLILIENDQYQSPQPPWQGPLCFLVVEHIYVHLSKGPPVSHTISAHAEAWANVQFTQVVEIQTSAAGSM